jgi:hypothetical protein
MKRRDLLAIPIAALLAGLSLSGCSAAPRSATDDVVGTWILVSSVIERDGKRTPQFGADARGMLALDAHGRFVLTIIGSDLPRFAANDRVGGTPEENSAVVARSIAMIGTYELDTLHRTLTFHVERSTFPNWDGTDQKRLLKSLDPAELTYETPAASSGGVGTVTWKRVQGAA